MHGNLLAQAFVYLAASVLAVPIAKRLGLGSVLGYLLAGVVLGPFMLGLIGREGEDVMHFAEFGVVMMLFMVGLELRPTVLWQLRRPILGLGGAQVAVTALAVMGIAALAGQPWRTGLALGLILAGSSTAIVLQSLSERGLLKTGGGQAAFSVLLFQDIAVIPILALLPLLATSSVKAAAVSAGARPAWQQALLVVGAVVLVVGIGRFVVGPLFRWLARTRLRELFTAAALGLVIGIALLMQLVGLSPALGTFLAGVVLADSEYRHELESDIEPFKGLLLGVFFVAVGAGIDFRTIAEHPATVGGAVIAVVAVKTLVLWALARPFGLAAQDRALFAVSLAQVGEFAFVLFSFAVGERVLSREIVAPLTAVVALSMLLTPFALMGLDRWRRRQQASSRATEREPDAFTAKEDAVVIAGFGRFGQIVGRLLRASGVSTTVLDLDVQVIDLVRRVGLEAYYGDASRVDLLHAAGCERARLFVVAVDQPEKSLEIVKTVKKHFPHLTILVRARSRQHYYQLAALAPALIVRETMGSALELGEAALRSLGFRAHQAQRLARGFARHDQAAIQKLAKVYREDPKALLSAARLSLQETERLLREEAGRKFGDDHAWDNETLRADATSRG